MTQWTQSLEEEQSRFPILPLREKHSAKIARRFRQFDLVLRAFRDGYREPVIVLRIVILATPEGLSSPRQEVLQIFTSCRCSEKKHASQKHNAAHSFPHEALRTRSYEAQSASVPFQFRFSSRSVETTLYG